MCASEAAAGWKRTRRAAGDKIDVIHRVVRWFQRFGNL